MRRLWAIVSALIAFMVTLGVHYRLTAGAGTEASAECAEPGPEGTGPGVVCTVQCSDEVDAVPGYWTGGGAFLGLSYAVAAGFFVYVLARVIARRGQGGIKSLLASAGLTGLVWLGLCWLVGCCGSPLLPVYVFLIGTKFLGITGPVALGLTVGSVALGLVCFHRAAARGCGCAECTAARVETAGPQKTLLERLGPWLKEERCKTCDCLQGALVQIELDSGEEMKGLVKPYRVPRERMHHCLGCEPCPPAEALSDHIRASRSYGP
jgi:hypothetical protein